MVDFAKLSAARKAKKKEDGRQLDMFSPGGSEVGVMPETAHKKMSVDMLSDDQREVYDRMTGWSVSRCIAGKEENLLTVGGYAGTGKSTLLGVFAAENVHLRIAFATFTGRAKSVLQQKLAAAGVQTTSRQKRPEGYKGRDEKGLFITPNTPEMKMSFCGTLHKLLYVPMIDAREQILGWNERERLDRRYDLIVVDEASMVGDDMLHDLKRHGVPILAVGDHGQLPPVMSAGTLMANPDLRLVKIHRQAKDNPIILFARHVRKTGELASKYADGYRIEFESRNNIDAVLRNAYQNVDSPMDVAILCWTNKARIRLNRAARVALGHTGSPRKGEIVICLKNMHGTEIYNGMRGVLAVDTRVWGDWRMDAVIGFPDEGIAPRAIMCNAAQFNRDRVFSSTEELEERGIHVDKMSDAGSFVDFEYALTVHRSQGSQMKHVIFYVEPGAERDEVFWKKFAYTAVTRAAEKLTIVT